MDSTPFSKKCEILYRLWEETVDSDTWYDFWETNDLGLIVAQGVVESLFNAPTSDGISWLENTWQNVLEYINIAPEDEIPFDSVEALLDYADYTIV
jgi:hypothetical protein